tara:strand:+ start:124 stop:882 length:759 start_codon:yes stop_codon:yes gene_type:complete
MFGKYFYNKNIRNIVVLFGTVFNDINVRRVDSEGVVKQNFKIPIAYGPAQKYLVRAEQNNIDNTIHVGISLPRMSFEIITMTYDSTRKLQTTKKIKALNSLDNNKLITAYTPVPYNFEIDLSIMVLNSDDGAQILEQILPYFTPEFQVTMNEMATLGIKRDIPIVLNSISTEDDYEGDFISRRNLVHTLSFTVQGYLYGPTSEQGVIREIDVNAGTDFDDVDVKLININVKPNPTTAVPDDNSSTTTTITDL